MVAPKLRKRITSFQIPCEIELKAIDLSLTFFLKKQIVNVEEGSNNICEQTNSGKINLNMDCGDSKDIIKCGENRLEFTCNFEPTWNKDEVRIIMVEMKFLSAKAEIKPYKVCTHVKIPTNGKF